MWRWGARQKKRPRLGLALSGGAARGVAHVGVLRVLREEGIEVDCVAGTSAGSIVGAAFAAGMTVEELEEFARTMRWRDFGRMTVSRLGVQSNARLEAYVRARFPVSRFEDLRVPFAAVATDLHTGAPVVMRDRGDLAFAVRASCALPGWYVPVTDEEGRQLVDGGLVANLPSSVARGLGADVVVAVDVNYEGARFLGSPTSLIGVLLQSIIVVQRTACAHQREAADVVISPHVGHVRWDDMSQADDLLRLGAEAARAAVPLIRELIEPRDEEPAASWFPFRRRREPQPAKKD